jgi:hypothetical protein
MHANAVEPERPLEQPGRAPDPTQVRSMVKELETWGVTRLPRLLSDQSLREMQQAFDNRLAHMRWNNFDGYERTERFRLMVQDVLTLAQGFVDLPLHPLVRAVLNEYLGPNYELCEAKGWKTLATSRHFHGWHGDEWYDKDQVGDRIPREIKLGLYLTDVRSGAFQYIKGTHGRQAPKLLLRDEASSLPLEHMEEFLGPAGSAFLFDTTGIHRQGIPILEPRQAVFYNFHDPRIPLRQEDVDYYRYHPLLLSAAFLGDLTPEDYRILGFGNKTNYQPNHVRQAKHRVFRSVMQRTYDAKLFVEDWGGRVFGKLWRMLASLGGRSGSRS